MCSGQDNEEVGFGSHAPQEAGSRSRELGSGTQRGTRAGGMLDPMHFAPASA